ncbi:hypothetical protein K2Q00_02480 [Patescibacteria group bacterium]|nr:hypothetical protein [Patescibacteria group bacterium]
MPQSKQFLVKQKKMSVEIGCNTLMCASGHDLHGLSSMSLCMIGLGATGCTTGLVT